MLPDPFKRTSGSGVHELFQRCGSSDYFAPSLYPAFFPAHSHSNWRFQLNALRAWMSLQRYRKKRHAMHTLGYRKCRGCLNYLKITACSPHHPAVPRFKGVVKPIGCDSIPVAYAFRGAILASTRVH